MGWIDRGVGRSIKWIDDRWPRVRWLTRANGRASPWSAPETLCGRSAHVWKSREIVRYERNQKPFGYAIGKPRTRDSISSKFLRPTTLIIIETTPRQAFAFALCDARGPSRPVTGQCLSSICLTRARGPAKRARECFQTRTVEPVSWLWRASDRTTASEKGERV